MGVPAVMMAMAATQAVTSISQGYAQGAEDKYNATIAGLQGQAAAVQGDITQGQLTRKGGMLASSQTAMAGAAGVIPTGSLAAVMLDTQTQINTDMAIAKYNTTMAENYASNQAAMFKRKAVADVTQGYESAFSDMLRGAGNAYMYGKSPNKINTN